MIQQTAPVLTSSVWPQRWNVRFDTWRISNWYTARRSIIAWVGLVMTLFIVATVYVFWGPASNRKGEYLVSLLAENTAFPGKVQNGGFWGNVVTMHSYGDWAPSSGVSPVTRIRSAVRGVRGKTRMHVAVCLLGLCHRHLCCQTYPLETLHTCQTWKHRAHFWRSRQPYRYNR